MNLHEFQAKALLARHGVPVPVGAVVETPEAAEAAARRIGTKRFAVKAQVHAGGRGLAGGVRLVDSPGAAREAAAQLLGRRLVTEQTGPQGRSVRRVYVEEAIEAARIIYVAALVDQRTARAALIGVRKGGEDIEARMARDPSIIETLMLDPQGRATATALADFCHRLEITEAPAQRATAIFEALGRALVEHDASLIEINPMAITADGDVVALDVKMAVDDNAVFRHQDLAALRDEDELDPVELEAQRHQINYIRMDGTIGMVVNGAGLALATLDMLCDAGGRPANFMDIRTTASSLDIAHGFGLLLANPDIKAVLVNVHGGGMQRCDTVAEGIGMALKRSGRMLPLVVRFAGNNAEFGRTLLENYGVAHVRAADMGDAVERVMAIVRQEAA